MRVKNLWLFDENRLLILRQLYKLKGDLCGKDLVNYLDIPKNLLSYHMSVLREKKYIKEVRKGKKKIYTLDKRREKQVEKILDVVGLL